LKENKFRVYCEFEFEGELKKCMESPASWFLLSQTGKLWTYDPVEIPHPIEKEYKVAIPLFYSGFKDINKVEIYEADIIQGFQDRKGLIEFSDGIFRVIFFDKEMKALADFEKVPHIQTALGTLMNGMQGKYVRVIGNKYMNKKILEKS